MSWDNPTDIETGAVRPNGSPWPETICDDCEHSGIVKYCESCVENPDNADKDHEDLASFYKQIKCATCHSYGNIVKCRLCKSEGDN